MVKFEIENNVLKKISVEIVDGSFVEKEEGFTCNWGSYIVKVPDGVVEIGENIFDSSCEAVGPTILLCHGNLYSLYSKKDSRRCL